MIKNYILFPSHSSGLALEKLLKEKKVKYTIVPTPRELSSCCGIAMEYNKQDEESIKSIVQQHSINIIGFRSIEKVYKSFY